MKLINYLVVVLAILSLNFLLDVIVEVLNLKNLSVELPLEFATHFDAQKYALSQNYLKDNTVFGLVSGAVSLVILLLAILLGAFNKIDIFSRSFGFGQVATGLVFYGIIFLASQVLSLPFSAYKTFIIEEKYGFNRTTLKTFLLDILKSWLLAAVLGSIVAGAVIWFFSYTPSNAWLWCWGAVTAFQLFVEFIAPVVIMPLFNKFIPMDEGELKNSLEAYAKAQDFKMKGLFKMDGSKRSSKSNAFFTGFGRFRRIVLFDTLIERHSVDELISVLAHEMGHYKKKHILKFMAASILESGFIFFVLSFFIGNRGLFTAFKMQYISVYAGILFFGFLYSPISTLTSIVNNYFSRKYEYEADAYAATTYKKPASMIEALKKLSVDNLSNLTPHSLKVFIEYSHPPVIARIAALRKMV